MEYGKDLGEYLRGKQRGKAANRLERNALSDPFLFEALEGLNEAKEDPLKVIEKLSRKIEYRIFPRKKRIIRQGIGIAAIFLVFLVLGVFFWQKKPAEKMIFTQYVSEEEADTLKVIPIAKREKKQELKQRMSVENTAGHALADSVVLDRIEKDSAEAVVEPNFRNRLAFASVAKERGKVQVENKGGNGPMPEGGIEAFERYIRDSLVYPEDARLAGKEGVIKLSFIVNQYGRPSGIRVIQWITNSCNHEAIRLLNNGPKWTYTGTADSTILSLPFYLDTVSHR